MNLTYGSSGSEVKKLQEQLNRTGYALDVDGIYGSQTRAAVRDYQKQNGLTVDGIAGSQTLGQLYQGSEASSSASSSKPTAAAVSVLGAAAEAPLTETVSEEEPPAKQDAWTSAEYTPADSVLEAETQLNDHLAQRPGDYTSGWEDQLNEAWQDLENRPDFHYDVNEDALYQQYRDQYAQLGQQAMMDTAGYASTLTGGYGNSYAQTAGQQTYQGYLQRLNDRVPELYNLALSRYQLEGDELYNRYALLNQRENQDYSRYADGLNRWYADLDRAQQNYNTERDYDYSKYLNDRNFSYAQHRDQTADSQWQQEFDENNRRYNQEYERLYGKSSGSFIDSNPDPDKNESDPVLENLKLGQQIETIHDVQSAAAREILNSITSLRLQQDRLRTDGPKLIEKAQACLYAGEMTVREYDFVLDTIELVAGFRKGRD